MSEPLSRRDFLKIMAVLSPSVYLSRFLRPPDKLMQDPDAKNVFVIVFDTLSARNISLYGYPRKTMPNLARIAERATVYHNHFAGGNWTPPGTASLLTGTYPWTHRAFNDKVRGIIKDRERNNIFNLFDRYYRIGYSHNSNVYRFLNQFSPDMDFIEQRRDLFLRNILALDGLFPHDEDIAPISWDRMMDEGEKNATYSLFFAPFYEKYSQHLVDGLRKNFPRGVPHTGEDDYFLLEDGVDWLISQMSTIQKPFLGYFHFLPPHHPYNTRREFFNVFADDGVGHYIEKPRSLLFGDYVNEPQNFKYQAAQRQRYDEFILYADHELGRLYDALEKKGALKDTWFVFTSDHGEMFERGVFGHRTPVLYQPVIQIPLIIVEPGQAERRDVFTPTSAVDVLPTLLNVTGQQVPGWVEGKVLPPFADAGPDRSVFAVEATDSDTHKPLGPASVMLVRGQYKLTYYFGYDETLNSDGPIFDLYDLKNDPEELNNIFNPDSKIFREFRDEVTEKIREVDRPFLPK